MELFAFFSVFWKAGQDNRRTLANFPTDVATDSSEHRSSEAMARGETGSKVHLAQQDSALGF